MRNLFSYFAFAIALFFASCTKEALPTIENGSNNNVAERSTTIDIEVSEISSSQISGELTVDFSSSDDLTEVVLEDTQYLSFTDTNNNTSVLTFQVNSFSGGNGSLSVAFSIGSNNLAGLTLTEVQEIIIEDEAIQ